MDVPATVRSALGDEEVAAQVQLKGEDAVFVTPSRTLVYGAEGLLSDESVEEFTHGAERVTVSEKRRKATITLDYGLDGERAFSVPADRVSEVLHPVLAGVLSAAGVTEAGETVMRTYRFSELTLVVTDRRIVKHVGSAAWDAEYEEIPYDEVTGLAVEEGTVASQLVIETAGRTERIKTPNEHARDVRETVEGAVIDYYDAATYAEFEALVAETDSTADAAPDAVANAPADASESDPVGFGEHDLELMTGSGDGEGSDGEEATAGAKSETAAATAAASEPDDDAFEGSPFETARVPNDCEELVAHVEALAEVVERQQTALEEQQELIEELHEALSRDR